MEESPGVFGWLIRRRRAHLEEAEVEEAFSIRD